MSKQTQRKKSGGKSGLWAWRGAAAVAVVAGLVLFQSQKPAVADADIVVYKSPTCGCCSKWVKHLEDSGFSVVAHNRNDMPQIKQALGVPQSAQSCHTAKIGGYVIEGHVPADVIARLLKEKPDIRGLAVPGLPMGSPGMNGEKTEPFEIRAFGRDGSHHVYAGR